ncbi:MAG: HAD family hydrolase [Bacteroidia bacterium]|nr:HAD family hydrolase [Bacteroidia bacterium]
MNYRHIIFDIDGTMLNTETADLLATQETVFQLTGEKKDPEEFRFAFGIPNSVVFPMLGIEDAEKASLMWAENYRKYHSTLRLFDGMENVLKELKNRGYILGIVTSKSRREFNADFVAFGLESLFDTVICVDDSPRPKPNSDPVLEYLKRANAEKSEAIYIGDTAYDAQCAHAAGIDFALAVWGAHNPEKIKADYYLKSPAEVLSFF